MRGNGTTGRKAPKKTTPNNSKARGSNPREILWRRELFSKRASPREMLWWNPKEHVSIATKWGITPKIVPSPKWVMRALR
jgi:hypothetical protein